MKNKIKIALLDTGVNALHPYLKNSIKKCYVVVCEGTSCRIDLIENNNNDNNGHGTAGASVIKKECPNIELYSFKILDLKGICNLQLLETALSYIKHMDIKLINLSLAIMDRVNVHYIKKICEELKEEGKIIVSALANRQKKSYPATLKNCIGVQGSILNTCNSLWFNQFKRIQCVVDSTPYLHCNKEGNYSMYGKCNSYSAAKLTGLIAAIMYENHNISRNQILENLKNRSEKKYWTQFDLRKSKRYPKIDVFKEEVNEKLNCKIEESIKHYLGLHGDVTLQGELLFSKKVGLYYDDCYNLLKRIELDFGFTIIDYTTISREDFYSVNHLAHLVNTYI